MERCKKREIRKRAWEAENQRGEAVCGKDPRTPLMFPWGFVVWVLPFYHLLRSARTETWILFAVSLFTLSSQVGLPPSGAGIKSK